MQLPPKTGHNTSLVSPVITTTHFELSDFAKPTTEHYSSNHSSHLSHDNRKDTMVLPPKPQGHTTPHWASPGTQPRGFELHYARHENKRSQGEPSWSWETFSRHSFPLITLLNYVLKLYIVFALNTWQPHSFRFKNEAILLVNILAEGDDYESRCCYSLHRSLYA